MTRMTPLGTVPATPRKRRDDRPRDRVLPRINVEVYEDEELVLAQAKMVASLRHLTFRESVIQALREWVEREQAAHKTFPREAGDGR
jgi:hypothetical protein